MIKFIIVGALILFAGCSDKGTTPELETSSTEGSANIEIIAGKVGALAKVATVAEIQLQTLFITLSAPGEDTILDTLAASGNEQLFYNKVYAGLASLKTWTVLAQSVDAQGVTIHQGATSFDVLPGANVDVALDLDAEYSMLVANFNPIQDSVTRVELVVDSAVVAADTVTKQSNIGGTETLEYDYLTTGSTHAITMNVYGDMWGFDTILYTGDTTITVVAAQDTTYEVLLRWVGPEEAYTGQATMSVTLGAVGTVVLNGTLESQVITDARDGQVYPITTIGNQTWMAENMKFVVPGSVCSDSIPARCEVYGRLYDWSMAMNGDSASATSPSGVQGVCPIGWHIPSVAEFNELTTAVDSANGAEGVGTSLKASYGSNGTDRFGFNGLPAGIYSSGSFSAFGSTGAHWASDEIDSTSVQAFLLRQNESFTDLPLVLKEYYFSVRCLLD